MDGRGLTVQMAAGEAQASNNWVLGKLSKNILRMIGVINGSWTVKVVRDAEMRELHGRMMGIWETTAVLTFDMKEEEMRNAECGMRKRRGQRAQNRSRITDHGSRHREGMDIELDAVICVDEARRRAAEMEHSVRAELLLYCVHSLLHVQGYDDVTPRGAREMHAREDEAPLVAAGVGAVYAGKNRETRNALPRKREKGNVRSRRR